ncbi:MAG TPA: hypothetical protein VIG76_14905 [Amnibacterium sp.]|jgi:hypothetical protein|uniref:hypothetical protein n=1 Tax=Amnibacterium sp. TaxID=1872496 RepID=UPI002F93C559
MAERTENAEPRWRRELLRDEQSAAAGIYGLVVSAGVMGTAHSESALTIVLAALITLLIYWCAERYSRVLAERLEGGQRLRWSSIRLYLTDGWEIVTVSGLPLATVLVARLLGATTSWAVTAGLLCSTFLLCLAGWEIGRRGRLSVGERVASAAVAGAFGGGLIVLEAALH